MTARRLALLLLLAAVVAGGIWYRLREPADSLHWLGYAEADYVKVAPTQQGRLVALSVARGDRVAAGAPLFAQDPTNDRAQRDQAAADLAQGREKLADLQAEGRPPEIAQARADLADAEASYDRIARDLARNEAMLGSGGVSRQTVDQNRADTRSAQARVEAARAKLALEQDPTGRQHAIAAQQAAVESAQAALAAAQWRLDQRTVTAPAGGIIADTYALPGETVAAGAPVVSLLPPGNIRVRFFVGEPDLARLRIGQTVSVACDSCPVRLTARISFVAPQPEYTPPVIYSEESRGTLVYLVEAIPDPDSRPLLKPGQPVDIRPLPAAAP